MNSLLPPLSPFFTDLSMSGTLFSFVVFLLVAVDSALLVRLQGRMLQVGQWISMCFWIVVALGFGGWIALCAGVESSLQYFSGLMLEGMLSVDNLVLAVAVLAGLGESSHAGRRILMHGVWVALVIRGLFFFFAAGTIQSQIWISALVALVMIVVGVRCLILSVRSGERGDCEKSTGDPVSLLERFAGVFLLKKGWVAAIVLVVAIELLNSILSVDSLSALLSTSEKPFILFSSSILGTILLRVSAAPVGRLLAKFPHIRSLAAAIVTLAGVKLLFPTLLSTPIFLAAVVALVLFGKQVLFAVRVLSLPVFSGVLDR